MSGWEAAAVAPASALAFFSLAVLSALSFAISSFTFCLWQSGSQQQQHLYTNTSYTHTECSPHLANFSSIFSLLFMSAIFFASCSSILWRENSELRLNATHH